MQLSKFNIDYKYAIKSYLPGKITVNNITYSNSLLITPQSLVEWGPTGINNIENKHITQLLNFSAEIILIGTGISNSPIANELLQPFYAAQQGFEVMTTKSACHTYTILAAESRNVLAALII